MTISSYGRAFLEAAADGAQQVGRCGDIGALQGAPKSGGTRSPAIHGRVERATSSLRQEHEPGALMMGIRREAKHSRGRQFIRYALHRLAREAHVAGKMRDWQRRGRKGN